MGACFGIFKKRPKSNKMVSLRRCVYFHDQDKVELELLVGEGMDDLMDEESMDADVWTMSKGELALLSSEKLKPSLEEACLAQNLANSEFHLSSSEHSLAPLDQSKPLRLDRDIPRSVKSRNICGPMEYALEGQQLLALDAYSLLASRAVQKRTTSCCSSTPPSSLDLEWENESGLQNTTNRPKSLPSSNVDDGGSCYSGGGGGSPESLEWDPCDPNVTDYETDQLINEIELLTRRALQETGDWTKRGS